MVYIYLDNVGFIHFRNFGEQRVPTKGGVYSIVVFMHWSLKFSRQNYGYWDHKRPLGQVNIRVLTPVVTILNDR